ncbi:LptE family protein [Aureibacter tunicatorum]|uniref:Lipopolysaccharide assembly protein n=1 Tax=Aureibacter tunicatorum TaxID=866807 RepID=A0AAE3XP43_9BACT|nr:LptE family protein [Aureibacter tunicatorum]MDR6239341.1 hypothetical protein [Aureibacter tunicatorum]BDD04736.1 hypothetical protein AUTU_22190 [Aureibacter tunicatorum]
MTFKKIRQNLLFIPIIFLINSCISYSFTGASIDYNKVKTISISNFYNETGLGPSYISQEFTNKLQDFFQQNTNLIIVEGGGDLQIDGSIIQFDYKPLAPVAGGNTEYANTDAAGVEQLIITVKASFLNISDDEFDFDNRSFSQNAQYDPSVTSRVAAEPELTDEILDQIVLDIFNATVANW